MSIELDMSRPWSLDDVDDDRHRPPFAGALLLAIALLLVLTGPALVAGGPVPVAWRTSVVGGFFWLTPRAVYTIDGEVGDRSSPLSLTARDPRSGDPLWSVDLTGPVAVGYTGGWDALVSRFPPTPNLGTTTMVIDTRTGRVVRAYPTAAVPLVYLADDVAVTIDRDPAAGAEPPLPQLSLDETGLDRRHLVTARDLATGHVRWTRALAMGTLWSLPGVRGGAEGIVALPPGQNWMVMTTREGTVSTVDLDTGRIVAIRDVGRLSQESYVTALQDEVVVRLDRDDEVTLSAYEPRTLVARWSSSPPRLYAAPFQCGPLLCLDTERSVWAIQPRTGAFVWRVEGSHLRAATGDVRRLVTAFGEPLALFDPATGRRLPADGQWRVVDSGTYGQMVVLAKAVPGDGAVIGLFDATVGSIRTVGAITPFSPASQCLAAGGNVACEDGNVVRVWRPR